MTTTILRRLRLERGYSSRALAAEVGVTHPVILRLERVGQGCHPRTRAGLVRALGVPFDVLMMPDTTNAADHKADGADARSPQTRSHHAE